MAKIRKNLSDTEMLANWHEEQSFETMEHPEEPARVRPSAKQKQAESYAAFFTAELQEKIGKALLEQKVKLYQAGVIDYAIKVVVEEQEIVLSPVPLKKKEQV